MKNNLLFFLLFTTTFISSQEIILSFDAKDEMSNIKTLDSIVVNNLTSNKSTVLKDHFTLNLSTKVLSVNTFDGFIEREEGLNLYPNPTASKVNIRFYVNNEEKNNITIFDALGKQIVSLSKSLPLGENTLQFTPNSTGLFFIKLIQNTKSYSSKLLVTASNANVADLREFKILTKAKTESKKVFSKTTSNLFFSIGDELEYVAHYKGAKHIIKDAPTASRTYSFLLNSAFYFAENGVTIKAYEDVNVGTSAIFNGTEYTLVDEDLLREMVKNDEDVTKVVTSRITNMSSLFERNIIFNQDIGSWDLSDVTDMSEMFLGAEIFNQNISSWDVSKVTSFRFLFLEATSFNQDLDSWNVENVENMYAVFFGATSFNRNINSWNVKNVKNMHSMFAFATSFNQPLGLWDVGNVETMGHMFSNATSFNQNIGSWNVSNVGAMDSMFPYATSFNQDIGAWDVSNVEFMGSMFINASSFNQDISGWNVCKVTSYAWFDWDTSSQWWSSKKPNFGSSTQCSGS